MKNLILLSFLMITTCGFAQIDTTSIIKPDAKYEIIDTSVFTNLEKFNDENDAVVYVYRLSSMVGAAAKWGVMVDNVLIANLKQKEYVVVHLNTTVKSHYFSFPDMIFNYTNFMPNRYYFIKLKGFTMYTGYFDENALSDLETCKLTKPLTK
ncbi:MAG: hypothetical protein JXB24_07800 [Bacteroidales bacterium]|nr:hypothetical protein [Bacteroidales bacterium]